jgi:hypothetical protein
MPDHLLRGSSRSVAHEREHAIAQKAYAAEREHYAHRKQNEWVYPLLDQVRVFYSHDAISLYRRYQYQGLHGIAVSCITSGLGYLACAQ